MAVTVIEPLTDTAASLASSGPPTRVPLVNKRRLRARRMDVRERPVTRVCGTGRGLGLNAR